MKYLVQCDLLQSNFPNLTTTTNTFLILQIVSFKNGKDSISAQCYLYVLIWSTLINLVERPTVK